MRFAALIQQDLTFQISLVSLSKCILLHYFHGCVVRRLQSMWCGYLQDTRHGGQVRCSGDWRQIAKTSLSLQFPLFRCCRERNTSLWPTAPRGRIAVGLMCLSRSGDPTQRIKLNLSHNSVVNTAPARIHDMVGLLVLRCVCWSMQTEGNAILNKGFAQQQTSLRLPNIWPCFMFNKF